MWLRDYQWDCPLTELVESESSQRRKEQRKAANNKRTDGKWFSVSRRRTNPWNQTVFPPAGSAPQRSRAEKEAPSSKLKDYPDHSCQTKLTNCCFLPFFSVFYYATCPAIKHGCQTFIPQATDEGTSTTYTDSLGSPGGFKQKMKIVLAIFPQWGWLLPHENALGHGFRTTVTTPGASDSYQRPVCSGSDCATPKPAAAIHISEAQKKSKICKSGISIFSHGLGAELISANITETSASSFP